MPCRFGIRHLAWALRLRGEPVGATSAHLRFNRRPTFDVKSADERLEKYLAQLNDADRGEEAGATRRSEALAAKIAKVREQRQVNQAMLERLKASGKSQISLTDPDARNGSPS